MRTIHTLPILATCLALIASDAHAYVDPGSGSVLLQVLLAGLLAVGFTLKTYWGNFKRRVAGLFSRSNRPTDDDSESS